MRLCAVDTYQVYLDGSLASYGPERTAAGYARVREIGVSGVKRIEVRVLSHGVKNYECDYQLPYFAAELAAGERTVYVSEDFECFENRSLIKNMPRYSAQRGYTEGYDLLNEERSRIEIEAVEPPKVIRGVGDTADYAEVEFCHCGGGAILPYDKIVKPHWAVRLGDPGEGRIDVVSRVC